MSDESHVSGERTLSPTNVIATDDELRELFGQEPDDDDVLEGLTVIQVCKGEWRKEASGIWRAWDDI